MNTIGLARHYDTLTAWERLPLLEAALHRGDDAEAERLARSAPTRPALVPHYYGLWEGLALLSVVHQMMQLDRACRLACGAGLVAGRQVMGEESLRRLRMLAFEFVVDDDAWKLLCAELRIDPDAILGHLPGCGLVHDMEPAASQLAFTAEEALAYLRSQMGAAPGQAPAARGEYRIDTAADVARGMQQFLAERAKRWL
jgi:hypothetical protein